MNFKNKYFLITLWILVIVLILFYLQKLSGLIDFANTILVITVLPTIIASLFYYLLRPLVRFLVNKKINKTVSVIGVLLVVTGLIAGLILLAGTSIANEYRSFFKTLSGYISRIPEIAEDIIDQDEFWIFSLEEVKENLFNSSQQIIESIGRNLAGWITNLTDIATILILIPVIVFFLLKDDDLFFKNMIKAVPDKFQQKVIDSIKEIDSNLEKYYVGQLIVAAFLGLLTYIGYLIIGLPNALFLSIFSMIFSVIPFLGPIIGVLPAIFIGWTVDLLMVVKVVIVLVVTQQLEGNIVRPKIIGNRLKIHPLTIIFLVIIAALLYGFIGAFFAIPLYMIIRTAVRYFLKKEQPQDN